MVPAPNPRSLRHAARRNEFRGRRICTESASAGGRSVRRGLNDTIVTYDRDTGHAARECEMACRELASLTTGRTLGVASRIGDDRIACSNAIVDASYVSAAAARLVSRYRKHPSTFIEFQVEVCRGLADACADACTSGELQDVRKAARACAHACETFLKAFEAAQGPDEGATNVTADRPSQLK